jgi:hypothetical protein
LIDFLGERVKDTELIREFEKSLGIGSSRIFSSKNNSAILRNSILERVSHQHNKIELVLKSIIAIEQIDFVFNTIIDNECETSLKQFIKNILNSNTGHLSYALNFFQR